MFDQVYAASPWPMLMLSSQGRVLGASDESAAGAKNPRAEDVPLRERAGHYIGLLKGIVPWLTTQQAESVRSLPSGVVVRERLHLRRTAWGSCLTVVDHHEWVHAVDPQTARLAALGFMIAGVCHEVTNPLTSLHSIVQILRADKSPSRELLDKGLDNIAVNVKRILDISRRLVTFARVGDEPRERFAVDEAVTEALYVLRHEGLLEHVELRRRTDDAALVVGNIGQTREIFLNLLVNAVQAMQGRGTLEVETRRTGAQVEVRVGDSGPGVSEAIRKRIFEPFFTTKGAGQGTGIGLAISKEIALDHGGTIELQAPADAEPGTGAVFCVRLPQAPA
ncbi:MAG: hypothetical protein KGL18_19170 [Burkholderiales bacterium]|nr:hypothetical protein [Burkholderiales bacterium]MDE1929081.1 hypothetical protein [Burkholderiales bacterium]MDE2157881.1 hypothetical protein [Burkholderiales bacterium]MDE2505092.1 hypothetical protein [Burkholderiales bacterium]